MKLDLSHQSQSKVKQREFLDSTVRNFIWKMPVLLDSIYISQYISDTCFKAPTHSSEETVQYFAKNLESSNFFDEFILS